MAEMVYCWRCQLDMPMLDEAEWQEIASLMNGAMNSEFRDLALDRFRQLTGHHETNINAIWHHRISLYGQPCGNCGKPLRTPKAKWCAACGTSADDPPKRPQKQAESGEREMSNDGPHFRSPQEKEAYWNMVRENHERIFGQLDREDRNKRALIWGCVIAVLAAIGYFFGPL